MNQKEKKNIIIYLYIIYLYMIVTTHYIKGKNTLEVFDVNNQYKKEES